MKRILFVDDDVPVLDGLRVRLHSLRARWEMVFVESASRAIAEFEHKPCDVVVTDIQMPGVDGAQLLHVVSKRWPQAIRIVLSGSGESERFSQLLSLAHQYLSKPCEALQIENVIDRCLRLHELLSDPRLRNAVGRVQHLPAIPRTYAKLSEIVSRENPSIADVSKTIGSDPVIAAKVLQVVNSAFFRRAKSITKIEQAVTHLGFVAIRNIVMSVEVFSGWPASLPDGFDPETLQRQAQKTAAIARSLLSGKCADEAMLAGLLHNIGHLILAQQCPTEFAAAVRLAAERGMPICEAQTAVIGASHAEVGAYLLGIWGLPHSIIEAVAFQNDPHKSAQADFDVLAALATAERLAAADNGNAGTACGHEPPETGDAYLRRLGAPFTWDEARERARRAVGELQT